MVDVDSDATEFILVGLRHSMTYNISLVALSVHLPSPVVGPNQITLGKIACHMQVLVYLFIDMTVDARRSCWYSL